MTFILNHLHNINEISIIISSDVSPVQEKHSKFNLLARDFL